MKKVNGHRNNDKDTEREREVNKTRSEIHYNWSKRQTVVWLWLSWLSGHFRYQRSVGQV